MILDNINTKSTMKDIDKTIKKSIKEFIYKNYFITTDNHEWSPDNYASRFKISKNPNADGKYIVDYRSTNKNITKPDIISLVEGVDNITNGYFVWGVVEASFDVSYRDILYLHGSPEYCYSFDCHACGSLKSLNGGPKEVGATFSINKPFNRSQVREVCNVEIVYISL